MTTAPQTGATAKVDPITLEIVNNALNSVADEMALVILRSAYSSIVRDSMDYSTALCDAQGRTIAQGLTNPVHLGGFPTMMTELVAKCGSQMREGDVYILNDPYGWGCMHLPDIFLVKPIFADGRVQGYAGAVVHHGDVGGLAPGSMALHATEVYQEGLRIPAMKLFDAGRLNEDLLGLLYANSRMPREFEGDLQAQIAACAAGERGVRALLTKYGCEHLGDIVDAIHDYAEFMARREVREMPDGVYENVDFIDGLGEQGEPIRFQVKVTVAADTIDIDWAGTSAQVKAAINGPIATTYSMCFMALRAAMSSDLPNCDGFSRVLTVRAPAGTIVNPVLPAACAGRGILVYRMLDVLLGAFAKIVPSRIPAAGEGGPTAISISGWRGGERWLITDGILGAWGGRSDRDGVDGISNPGCNLSNQPIELIEARHPLRVEEYGFVKNSGGPGRWRGGLATTRAFRVLDEEASLTIRADRRRFLPSPLEGGWPGTPSISVIESDEGRRLLPTVPMKTLDLKAQDVLRHITAGAAGLGDPLERPEELVAADVLDDKIDADFAAAVYGVVVDARTGVVDADATAKRRAEYRGRADMPHLQLFLRAAGLSSLGIDVPASLPAAQRTTR